MKLITMVLAAGLAQLWGQEIKMPASLAQLAGKADATVDVTLDGSMLKLAGQFLSDKDGDQAKTKKLLSGLQSISVKSYSFTKEGQYNPADLDAVRSQAQAPQWSRIVGVTSKKDGDNVDVFFKDGGNGTLAGILVIAAEPKELTIVSIVGTLDPAQLADLGGQFGIPKLKVNGK